MTTRCPAMPGPRKLFSFASCTSRRAALLALMAAVALLPTVFAASSARAQAPVFTKHRYVNLVDRSFATVSNGPQSAIVLESAAGATEQDDKEQIRRAALASWRAQARTLGPQIARMHKAGTLKSRSIFPVSTIIATSHNGVVVTPQSVSGATTRAAGLTRAVGGGTLTFTYSGFNSTDQAFLQQVVSEAYPAIVSLYGQPAVTGTVTVVNAGTIDTGGTLTDSQYLSFGVYDPSHNQILLPTYASNESFVQAFILNIIHAFHGPAIFQYDAWEQGFARAATAIIARQTAGTIGITDPSGNFLLDLLPYYDLLNQPALGNSTFIPSSQANITLDTSGGLLAARLGMSGAAWLKVYIENPDFFRQFNTAYYAQFDVTTNASLAGNVPALRAIAAPLLPNGVEALPWDSWYEQQFILNTAYSAGEQLFVYEVPDTSTDQAQSFFLTYYIGQKNGDETLVANATAYATYFDSTDSQLNFGVASEQAAIVDGAGSLTAVTTSADAGRITANIHVGNAVDTVYVPSGFSGDFQAVVLGPNATGNVTVSERVINSATTRTATGALSNAGFGVNLSSDISDLAATTITIANNGANASYRRNTGDGQYYAVIRNGNTGGGVVVASHTFSASDVPSLISFPVTPLNPIVDQALGLSGSAFVLSFWNVAQSSYETLIPGQPSVAPITMGRGYWFKIEPNATGTTQSVSVNGTAPSTDTDFVLSLPYGWNMIGSPFAAPIDISNVLVQYQQNDAIGFSDAVSSSLIAAQPFSWDPTTATYSATSTIDGTGWQGYWIRVLVPNGVTLLLPGPDSTSRAAAVHRAALSRSVSRSATASAPDWTIRLRAAQSSSVVMTRGAGTRVATASFGVGRSVKASGYDNRYDLEAPPSIVSTLAMRFPHKEWNDGKSTGNYVADYRSTVVASQKTTWDVELQTPTAGTVTVSWDGMVKLPKMTRLTLVDVATGTRTLLRSRSSYTFSAGANATRAFQIVAEPERSLPLSITPLMGATTRAMTTRSSRSASVNVAFMVSTEADVSVQFTSLTGRVVRHMPTTRAASTLAQSVRWDGKNDGGQALPPGLYRAEIIARADDGTQARFERPVMLLQ